MDFSESESDPSLTVELYQGFWHSVEVTLNLLGISRFNVSPPKAWQRRALNLYCYLSVVWVNLALFGELLYFFFHPEDANDFIKVMSIFSYGSYSLMSQFKMLKLLGNAELLQDMLQQIRTLYPKVEEQRHRPGIGRIVWRQRRWVRRYIWLYFVISVVSIALNSFMGVTASAIAYWVNGPPFDYRLPFIIYIPFDTQRTLGYTIGYLYQSWTGVFCTQMSAASDTVFFYLVIQMIIQFDTIAFRLREFRPDGRPKRDLEFMEKIVRNHEQALNIASRINDIFQFSIFVTFGSAISIICSEILKAKISPDYVSLMKNSLLMIYEVYQIWLTSMVATRMKQTSLAVGDAAFEQQWFPASAQYRKSLSLVIHRSQRPAVIKGYIFKMVDMEDFRDVMTYSYKFLAALNAMLP